MIEEAHQRELREAELLLKIQIDDFAGEEIDPEDEPDLYLPLPAAKALHEALATTRAELAAKDAEIARLWGHINHMANWITRANRGVKQGPYSFEALGEDLA